MTLSVVRDIDVYRSRRAPGRGVSDCRAGLERVYVNLLNFWVSNMYVRAERNLEFRDSTECLDRSIHVASVT